MPTQLLAFAASIIRHYFIFFWLVSRSMHNGVGMLKSKLKSACYVKKQIENIRGAYRIV